MNQIKLGSLVRDQVSGFQGIALIRIVRPNGNVRVCVAPRVGEDNKMPESYDIDEHLLEVVGEGVTDLARPLVETEIELHDKVQDRFSDVEGTVIERREHLSGCVEFIIQPHTSDLLGLPREVLLDVSRLERVRPATEPVTPPRPKGSARSRSQR